MNKKFILTLFGIVFIAVILFVAVQLFAENYFLNKNEVHLPSRPTTVVPVMSDEVVKGDTVNTYINHTLGFKFEYPKNFTLDNKNYGLYVYLTIHDTDYRNALWITSTSESFSQTEHGSTLSGWVAATSPFNQEPNSKHFSNKIGDNFSVDGLETIHLESDSSQAGFLDLFYFLKADHLFTLDFQGTWHEVPENPPEIQYDLIDFKKPDWRVALLKSFKFSDSF